MTATVPPPRGAEPPRLRAPLGFERAPGAECAHQPSGDLRILRIEFEHDIGDEIVARAVEAVELGMVGLRERPDQRAHPVRVGHREERMRGERLYAIERRRLGNGRLQGEPFVDDQRIVGIARIEIVERVRQLRPVVQRQRSSSAAMRSFMLSALLILMEREFDGLLSPVAAKSPRQTFFSARRPALFGIRAIRGRGVISCR